MSDRIDVRSQLLRGDPFAAEGSLSSGDVHRIRRLVFDAPPVLADRRAPRTFAIVIGVVIASLAVVLLQRPSPSSSGRPAQRSSEDDQFSVGTVPSTAPGLTLPQVKKRVDPKYTLAAMRVRLEGDVMVDAVISVDGLVLRTRISKEKAKNPLHSLAPDPPDIVEQIAALEFEAQKAIEQWIFEPAAQYGSPVTVLVTQAVTFNIH